MSELIQVVQLPVIEQRLKELKEHVDQQVADALALVCTEETIGTVKTVRAELNRQFQELETQRKAVKKAVLGPYESFETVYRECVSDSFKAADAELKGKISDVENDIKMRCEMQMRQYFAELCRSEHVEWLTYEKTGIKVGMADAKSKNASRLKEQIASFVTGVSEAVSMISQMENGDEILVEYQATLNAATSMKTVQERHRRILEERLAKERRQAQLEAEEAAARKVAEAMQEEQQAQLSTADPLPPPTETAAESPALQAEENVDTQDQKLYKCTFTVKATREQLKLLKEFLNKEGIRYE